MANDPVRTRLREFITTNFMIAPDDAGFEDADSLLHLGLIDSMGVMEIVGFLKKEYGITVAADEVRPENLDSVRGIADFIRRKKGL